MYQMCWRDCKVMQKQEAGEVIQYVIDLFDVDMNERKIKAWARLLMERGDYTETMKNIKQRATNGSRFKPTISEIIITSKNKGNEQHNNYSEEQTHAYKKKHDESYSNVIKKMEGLRNKLVSEVKEDE